MQSTAVDMKERLRARIQARKMQMNSPDPEGNGQSTSLLPMSQPEQDARVPSAAKESVVLVGSPNAKARERLKERRRSLRAKRELAKQTSSMPVQPAPVSHVRVPVVVNEFDLDSSDSSDETNVGVPVADGVSDQRNPDDDDDSLSVGVPSSPNLSSAERSSVQAQTSRGEGAVAFEPEDTNPRNAAIKARDAPSSGNASGGGSGAQTPEAAAPFRGVQMSPRDAIEAAWIDVEMKKADDKFLEVICSRT
eukprot:INCI13488.12.p1 GENE.INCI13488.12~~INCI13488.12.p1  ORF type:complete len:250 (-),score=40.82 INCI13488.12:1462-2211(-)